MGNPAVPLDEFTPWAFVAVAALVAIYAGAYAVGELGRRKRDVRLEQLGERLTLWMVGGLGAAVIVAIVVEVIWKVILGG